MRPTALEIDIRHTTHPFVRRNAIPYIGLHILTAILADSLSVRHDRQNLTPTKPIPGSYLTPEGPLIPQGLTDVRSTHPHGFFSVPTLPQHLSLLGPSSVRRGAQEGFCDHNQVKVPSPTKLALRNGNAANEASGQDAGPQTTEPAPRLFSVNKILCKSQRQKADAVNRMIPSQECDLTSQTEHRLGATCGQF
jgi:hypothetical protein